MGLIIYKFLENKNWYYYDEKELKYKLTNNATKEAKESYNEYEKQLKK